MLANLEALTGGEGDASCFAENGANPERIKKLLAEPQCQCQCRMPSALLVKACRLFWSLPKSAQDALLWSLQCGSGRKSVWSIEGWGS